MDERLGFVFPGQGSQTVGMLANMTNRFPLIVEMYHQASEVLEYDLWEIVCKGPEERLNQTSYTQPAMLVADVAMFRILQQKEGNVPEVIAGHSLGEYAALVAAESIDFLDAVNLVSYRARLMQEVVAEVDVAMGVTLALSSEQVVSLCHEISEETSGIVEAVNFNAPGQVVIAGHTQAVDLVLEKAKQLGAKKAKKLPVSVPSHCRLMAGAADKLADYLVKVPVSSPKIPVINNVDVAIVSSSSEIKDALVRQLFHPVRWIEVIEKMVSLGINTVIECGPGKVLTSINKRINKEIVYQEAGERIEGNRKEKRDE